MVRVGIVLTTGQRESGGGDVKRRTIPDATVPALASAITVGVAGLVSLIWLGLVHRYVARGPGWDHLLASHPTDFAVFMASVGAPLAICWLIAVFALLALGQRRLQHAVLRAHWQAGRTTEEIEALVRTSIEMQEQARRQSFLNGADLALKDLNSQAGMIVGRLGVLGAEDTEYLWALNAAGDPWAFCHALLERSVAAGFVDDLADRVASDEVALAGLHRFLRRYERLLALAKEYDANKLVREVLEDGPLDRVHALFQAVAVAVQARLGPPLGQPPHGMAHGLAIPDADPDTGPRDPLAVLDDDLGAADWSDVPDMPDHPPPGYADGPLGRGEEPGDGLGERLVRGMEAVLGPGGPVDRFTEEVRARVADWRRGGGSTPDQPDEQGMAPEGERHPRRPARAPDARASREDPSAAQGAAEGMAHHDSIAPMPPEEDADRLDDPEAIDHHTGAARRAGSRIDNHGAMPGRREA